MSYRRPSPSAAIVAWTIVHVPGLLWRWRLEVGVAVLVWATTWLLLLPVVLVAAWPRIVAGLPQPLWLQAVDRAISTVREPFVRASVRRRLHRGLDRAGLPPVLVRHIERAPSGWKLRVMFAPGTSGWPDKYSGALASSLRCRAVKVTHDVEDARRGTVRIVTTDPLADMRSQPWPLIDRDAVSLWHPIPVGVDEHGNALTLTLPERHVLIGGAPGGGKSVATSMLVAAAALDPDAHLFLLDGKEVDLAVWKPLGPAFAGANIDDAIAVLRTVRTDMENAYAWLRDNGLRKLPEGSPLSVLVIDELAYYYGTGSKNKRKEFSELLRDMVARGRAAGTIVIAATQKPSTDTIPSAFRDLFGYRWAMRATTNAMSDTILGAGWASQGYDASTIAAGQPGTGFLLAEESQPRRCRTYLLTDPHLDAIVARALRAADDEPVEGVTTCVNGASSHDRPTGAVALRTVDTGSPDAESRSSSADADVQVVQHGDACVTVRENVMARLMEHLNGDPISARALARAIARPSTDATVRRALAQLEAEGRAVRVDGGWCRA